MKKLSTKLLIAATLILAALSQTFASHMQGSQITYTSLGPNIYFVKYTKFKGCESVSTQPVSLSLSAPGCNPGRTISLSLNANTTVGDPFCSAALNACVNGSNNFEQVDYTGILTFSAAEGNCPDWRLSVTESGPFQTANLQTASQGYIESFVNLQAGIDNNSPVFSAVAPVRQFVCVGQDIQLSFNATDPDCDSLSYQLVAPMSAANTNIPYKPIQGVVGGLIQNPSPPAPYCNNCNPPNPQLAQIPGHTGNYLPTYPMPSYIIDWSKLNPTTGIPYQFVTGQLLFNLNPTTGQLNFHPSRFVPNSNNENQYLVTVEVSEWRKLMPGSNVATKVGTVRREVIIIVYDCAGNEYPAISSILANGRSIQPGDVITLRPGVQLNLQAVSADQNAQDILELESDVAAVLPGALLNRSTGNQPTATISWTAPITGFCGVKYFYLRVRDNACPAKGHKTYLVGVRVNSGTATGTKEELRTSLQVLAFPNPFSQAVTFRIIGKQAIQEIQIYNALGQIIDRLETENVTITGQEITWKKAQKLPAGTYLAKIISSGKPIQTIKFSKL